MSQPSYNPDYNNAAPPPYYPQQTPYPQQNIGHEQYQQGPPPYQYAGQYPGQYSGPGTPYGHAAPYPQQPPNTVIYREQPRTVYVYENDRRRSDSDAADCCLIALCAACLCCCLMDN